jgi:flagellar FliL protein
MAKASAPTATPAASAPATPRRGMKLLVILIAAVVILLLAGAAVIGLLLLKKGGQNEAALPDSATVDLSRPPTFVTLDPFVVNLAPGEGERYLQIVMALRVADNKTAESLKSFMPEIRHRINLVLSGKLPSELATPEGREALASQIADEANQALGAPPARTNGPSTGPIQSVLFNSIIIQ